ncbi:WD40/YVTN/BNR-like repeat-containing protein [Fictibacillus enclensis]|uniref:WD40/YVTN/BNR-like repeat-containing protein n=1 Tax=Fictibacillus enclensis TaxID=1017270 RepID=UPI0024C0D12D|nr:sialidase family protein [Fictibacillus enclensis]WHY70628.1 sialidase family protein [Fictibacillus enclensis]
MTSYHHSDQGKGIRSAHVTFVVPQPEKEGIVWTGTEPSAVYYSEDKGESWRECQSVQNLQSKVNWQFPPRPYTSHVRWITLSYSDPSAVSVSIEFGAVIRSFDGGYTWKNRPFGSPLDAHTLLAHPNQPGTLFAACGDSFMIKGHSYAESHDEGETWNYDSEGLEKHPYLYNMVIHHDDPDEKLVAAAASPSTGASRFAFFYHIPKKW